ncbi:MAG: hypothetical protein QT02_C0005G0006 [archaeon GW2011_AR9]|nr:MAG: hypothetical protein QT02_C0005G0006 [archaeon GW2011_AR9]
MPIYIIEHLEPKLWEWSIIEYKHIAQLVGKSNCWITHLKTTNPKLRQQAKVIPQSVTKLGLSKVCVLDPEAPKMLTPLEAKKFDYFVFGGILGDHPAQKRTKKELTQQFPFLVESRNIGKVQMSTDNAVAVVQEIVKGAKFSELHFQDEIEIPLQKNESVLFPYRYLLREGKPLVSPELIAYLKKKNKF